ncbi:hypothetical protein DAPPUDRAFT_343531, partial [Daphnia pulex]
MAQKLSAEAAKRKAARDLAYAKTPDRRAKKADAQRRRRADPKSSVGKDWDHKNQRWESPAQNRDKVFMVTQNTNTTYGGSAALQAMNEWYTMQDIIDTVGASGLQTQVRYSPTFEATGMTFTGSGTTYPTYNSYYVKAGQYKVALPFLPSFAYNHFSGWIWADPNIPPDSGTGHTILNADTSGVTTVLALHYLKQSGGANWPIREGLWVQ